MLFNKEEYKHYLLTFILNNNLPFSIIETLESNSFNNLIKYLKDNLLTISKTTIGKKLDAIYNLEINKLKSLLNKIISKYSITINE